MSRAVRTTRAEIDGVVVRHLDDGWVLVRESPRHPAEAGESREWEFPDEWFPGWYPGQPVRIHLAVVQFDRMRS